MPKRLTIKDRIEAAGLRPEQVAVELGVSYSTVLGWMAERRPPSFKHAQHLAELLRCSLDDIAEGIA